MIDAPRVVLAVVLLVCLTVLGVSDTISVEQLMTGLAGVAGYFLPSPIFAKKDEVAG